ncbi:MAG: hypothetical protein PHD32_11005 [Eubacteriales bacterium]|nr:hypothetical protein [Eubacteriales bacterium]
MNQRYQLTKEKLVNHFRYSPLIYLVSVVGCVMLGVLIYSVTKPELPGGVKVDIMTVGYVNEAAVKVWCPQILERLDENQKEVTISQMSTPGAGYDKMFLMAHLANQEGDLFIMDKETFEYLTRQGAFLELSDMIQTQDFQLGEGATPQDGYVSGYAGTQVESGIYGLSLKGLPGLLELGFDPNDCYIAFTTYNDNLENSIKTVKWILETKTVVDTDLASEGLY